MSDDDILRNLTRGVRVQVDPKAVSTHSVADVLRSFSEVESQTRESVTRVG
jgi:hypothetical protein